MAPPEIAMTAYTVQAPLTADQLTRTADALNDQIHALLDVSAALGGWAWDGAEGDATRRLKARLDRVMLDIAKERDRMLLASRVA